MQQYFCMICLNKHPADTLASVLSIHCLQYKTLVQSLRTTVDVMTRVLRYYLAHNTQSKHNIIQQVLIISLLCLVLHCYLIILVWINKEFECCCLQYIWFKHIIQKQRIGRDLKCNHALANITNCHMASNKTQMLMFLARWDECSQRAIVILPAAAASSAAAMDSQVKVFLGFWDMVSETWL